MLHFPGSNERPNRDGEVNGVAELFVAINLLNQLIYLVSVKVYSFFFFQNIKCFLQQIDVI